MNNNNNNESIFNNKIITVTGGAGLIGSYIVENLVNLGGEVVVIDDFSKGKVEYLSKVIDKIEIREGNLEDSSFSFEALSDAEVIFHLASRAYGVGYSKGNTIEILRHNEAITNNLFNVVEKISPEYILVSSSSCVYSDEGPELLKELPLFLGEPEIANWGYGWAKRFLEQKAVIYSRELNIPIGIVRPFNIYGERYTWVGENSQAIPMLVKRIMDGENPVHVWGSGNQRRSYVHALDCANAIVKIAEKKFFSGPVNIGTRETISISELVKLICKLGNVSPELEFDITRPEGRFVKSTDTSLLNDIVPNYKPSVSLKEGMAKMIEWYFSTSFNNFNE